jgi:hypothetical protein
MKPKMNLFERGREFERGRSPLSLKFPSPAKINSGLVYCPRLERGRGEEKLSARCK